MENLVKVNRDAYGAYQMTHSKTDHAGTQQVADADKPLVGRTTQAPHGLAGRIGRNIPAVPDDVRAAGRRTPICSGGMAHGQTACRRWLD